MKFTMTHNMLLCALYVHTTVPGSFTILHIVQDTLCTCCSSPGQLPNDSLLTGPTDVKLFVFSNFVFFLQCSLSLYQSFGLLLKAQMHSTAILFMQ